MKNSVLDEMDLHPPTQDDSDDEEPTDENTDPYLMLSYGVGSYYEYLI